MPNVEFLKSLPYTFYSFLAHVHSLNLFLKHWTQSHAIDFSHQGRASPLENIKAYETVEKVQNIRIYFLNGYSATCMRIMVQFFFLILGVYKIVLYSWTTAGFSFASKNVSPVHFLLQTPIVNVSVSLETIVRRSSLKKEDECTIKITSVILENTYHMKKPVEGKGVVLDMDF